MGPFKFYDPLTDGSGKCWGVSRKLVICLRACLLWLGLLACKRGIYVTACLLVCKQYGGE